jgi:trehalose/maltose hydrolase-like predicted phosphorylase
MCACRTDEEVPWILGGLPVINEDLVNLPNWLVLQLRIEDEGAIRLADVELLDYRHELDIRYATVVRDLHFRDRSGRKTALQSRRFVSMAGHHRAGTKWTLVPENRSGRVEVVTAIDRTVFELSQDPATTGPPAHD